VKGIKPFISGLTFARGNNQPFRSNAIAFLSSSRADIQTFDFENTVEGDTFTDINISHTLITSLCIVAGYIWLHVAILL
jgi:hypothetical protein